MPQALTKPGMVNGAPYEALLATRSTRRYAFRMASGGTTVSPFDPPPQACSNGTLTRPPAARTLHLTKSLLFMLPFSCTMKEPLPFR